VKETKDVACTTAVTISVKCNMCTKEMMTECSPEGNGASIGYNGGYDSEFIGDGVIVVFDICEECLFKIIEELKIPPSRVEYDT